MNQATNKICILGIILLVFVNRLQICCWIKLLTLYLIHKLLTKLVDKLKVLYSNGFVF